MPIPPKIIRWLVIVAMPFFLGFSIIRLVISPAYPTWEYSRPHFPDDRYGLTQAERLDLALVAVRFLERPEPAEEIIGMLGEQRLPDGVTPLYNERELSHMIDVKNVTDAIYRINWIAAPVVLLGVAFLLGRSETRSLGYRTLRDAGLFTVAILVGIAGFIVIAWDIFFVQFHELLFPPGSWTFAYSDGLIRLFPETFWFDIGIIMSGGTLLAGALVAVAGHLLVSRDTRRPQAALARTPA